MLVNSFPVHVLGSGLLWIEICVHYTKSLSVCAPQSAQPCHLGSFSTKYREPLYFYSFWEEVGGVRGAVPLQELAEKPPSSTWGAQVPFPCCPGAYTTGKDWRQALAMVTKEISHLEKPKPKTRRRPLCLWILPLPSPSSVPACTTDQPSIHVWAANKPAAVSNHSSGRQTLFNPT